MKHNWSQMLINQWIEGPPATRLRALFTGRVIVNDRWYYHSRRAAQGSASNNFSIAAFGQ
jgi:hypothetical protein